MTHQSDQDSGKKPKRKEVIFETGFVKETPDVVWEDVYQYLIKNTDLF